VISHPVIITGAGISGLAAAYELHQRGVPSIVLEASDRIGGVILTERDGPLLVDAGPDSMLATKRAATALCEELGLGPRLIRTRPPRTAFVLTRGRLVPFPQPAVLGLPITWRALAGASMISPLGRARMALEPWIPPQPGADESIASFIGRRFGREAVERIAEPLLAGIHAGDVDRLSAHALFPSLVAAERERGSVIKGLRAVAKNRSPEGTQGSEGAFVSLRGGMRELVDALSCALPAGTIRLRTRVRGIRLNRDGGYTVETLYDALTSRAIVLAAPAWSVSEVLASFDGALAALCAEILYTSTAIVVFAFKRSQVQHPLAGSGFVVPRKESRSVLAATWISSKWGERAPADSALVRVFLGGARDPGAVEMSDAELAGRALAELAPIVGVAGNPEMTRTYRWRRASAQHDVGHLERLSRIDARLAAHPGLFVTGSGFRVTGIPDCIADARETAGAAAAFLASAPPPPVRD
jgi:protoporphyrinogen/coproporphyrinogen III oxidase